MKRIGIIAGLFSILCSVTAQVRINEVGPSNLNSYADNYGEYPDWVELYNSGSQPENLTGYALSDDPFVSNKWIIPELTLAPGEFKTVFLSGKNTVDKIDHWESAVVESDMWRYTIPDEFTSTDWNQSTFNDNTWDQGIGGIGYDDGDDATELAGPYISLFMRTTFTIADTAELAAAAFHMDYDDGFVAYVNGQEIARANMSGTDYDDFANSSHEAEIVNGGTPDEFLIDIESILPYLVQGENVLAIQVHNNIATSSDMTARPTLSFGLKTANQYWNAIPAFFTPVQGETFYHTNFSLNNGKEGVLLFNPQGTPIDGINPPEVLTDMSYGRTIDGGNQFKMFLPATPGATNVGAIAYDGIWSDVLTFDLPAGFYATNQTVSISAANALSVIRYTTDGSKPTSSSTVYNGAISVTEPTVIRAGAFRPDYISQTIETNSYIIGNSNNPQLPVMSISTDPDGFFSFENGIYELGPNASGVMPNYGANFWEDWEREIHFEYFDENDQLGIEQTCGVKIFGGWSRDQDMKSLRLMAKEEYGDKDFDYAFFKSKNHDSYRQLVLRNSGNDFNNTHFRDALNHETIKEVTNLDIMAYQPTVVFINGEYWGIHNLRERINDHYIEDNHGIDNDDINLIENSGDEKVKYGDDMDWLTTVDFITNNDMSILSNYDQAKVMMDIPNVIDFFCSQTYHINWDSPHNNVRVWRPKDKSKGWRYLYYDTDFGLNLFGGYSGRTAPEYNELGRVLEDDRSSHSFIINSLLANNEFKCQFANRYADLMNTVYKAENYRAVVDSIQNLLASDIGDHFDRWGGDITGWNYNISEVTSFIDDRESYVRGDLASELTGLGNDRTITLNVSPAEAGRVVINTVTPDDYSWTGDYFAGCPVTVSVKPNVGYEFSNWSGLSNSANESVTLTLSSNGTITANFVLDNTPDLIAINEINYNSPNDTLNSGDWLELYNYGVEDVDLSGWTLKDANDFNGYSFPQGTIIRKGEYVVVAADMIAFAAVHQTVTNVVGPLGFKLSSSGEEVRLYDGYDRFYSTVTYNNKAPWSEIADGKGGTLELLDPTLDITDPSSWFGGCLGGSPGTEYTECPCEGPFLGDEKYLCESGGNITLNTGLTLLGGNEFKWYLNGDRLPDTTATLVATVEGLYSVILESPTCLKESSVEVLDNISVDLGPGFNLCTPSEATLSVGSIKENTTYNWFRNNINQNVASPSIKITSDGDYRIEVKRGLCPKVSSTVSVTSSTPTPNDATNCNSGNMTLSVTGSSTYSWYANPEGGNSLRTGSTYNVNVSETTTYYVEDDEYFGYSAGPTNLSFNSAAAAEVWTQDPTAHEDYKMRFYINNDCYLNYVTVFSQGSGDITIRITTGVNTGVVHEVTVPATGGEQRVYLGRFLTARGYYMDAVGSTVDLRMNGDGASYPYDDAGGYVSLTRTEPNWADDLGWYFFFYNFEVANSPVQEKCDRTPVTAYRCDPPLVNVNVDASDIRAGERVEFTATVDGEYNSISWDFGSDASPRYAEGVGPHAVVYNSRGVYDVTVTVSDNNDNYETTETSIVTVCSAPGSIELTADATEYCGTAVNLDATLISNYEYTWYLDGIAMGNGSLNDNTEQVMNIADYYVVVADPYNTALCNTASNEVYVSNCVLSTTFTSQDAIGLFPNPSSNTVQIQGVEGTVELRDMTGVLIESYNGTQEPIDVSQLPSGMYIIHVRSLSDDHLFKLIKE